MLRGKFKVLNIGLHLFAEVLREKGVEVVELEWRPKPELEEDIKRILDKLL